LLPFVVFQLAADASEVSAPGFIAAILFPFTCSAATIRADAEEKITRSLIIVLKGKLFKLEMLLDI
jgi:hypothetical protein